MAIARNRLRFVLIWVPSTQQNSKTQFWESDRPQIDERRGGSHCRLISSTSDRLVSLAGLPCFVPLHHVTPGARSSPQRPHQSDRDQQPSLVCPVQSIVSLCKSLPSTTLADTGSASGPTQESKTGAHARHAPPVGCILYWGGSQLGSLSPYKPPKRRVRAPSEASGHPSSIISISRESPRPAQIETLSLSHPLALGEQAGSHPSPPSPFSSPYRRPSWPRELSSKCPGPT